MGRRLLITALLAVGCVAGSVVIAVTDAAPISEGLLVSLAVGAGLAALIWQLYRSRSLSKSSDEPGPELAPERSPDSHDVSGRSLPRGINIATKKAVSERDIAAGLAVLRPRFRERLGAALAEGGKTDEEIKTMLAEGTWTDDPAAAAVLDESVPLPTLSLRNRIVAWLFPDRVVRTYALRAVSEMARTAEESLPPVPGQDAPRTVPRTTPPMEQFRQGLDGSPERSADPFAVDRGQRGRDGDAGGRGTGTAGTQVEGER